MGKIRDKYSNYLRNLDGIQGYVTEFYFSARIGKHYCPYCNSLLQLRRKKEIVNSEQEGRKKSYLYMPGDGSGGNYIIAWEVYYCANCDKEMPTGVILGYERELKKTGGNITFNEYEELKNGPDWKKHDLPSLLLACAIVAIVAIAVILIPVR